MIASALTMVLLTTGLSPGSGSFPIGPAPGTTGSRPEVVERFSPPSSAWGPGHRGVDLLGRPGAPVVAARAGRVTFAGRLAGRGVVVVSHGARRTTYEPVTAAVSLGQQVDEGERLGLLESHAASHCWPQSCLHWGLIASDRYLDPLTLVSDHRVRLLPLQSATGSGGSLAASPSRGDGQFVPVRPVGGPVGTPGEAGPS
jgi:murein DD-endopeptidase MepM/ murein hydrolase activator NlpD